MPYAYGDLAVGMLIGGAALLLGLVTGIVAVGLLTSDRAGRFSLRALMGLVALAALLSSLIAALPRIWAYTASIWALAVWGMAIVDLAVICLLDSSRTPGRFSRRARRRIGIGLLLATALLIAAIAVRFDLGWVIARRPWDFIGHALSISLPVAILDLMVRFAAIRLRRWRHRES